MTVKYVPLLLVCTSALASFDPGEYMALVHMFNKHSWACNFEIVDQDKVNGSCLKYYKYRTRLVELNTTYPEELAEYFNRTNDIGNIVAVKKALEHITIIDNMVRMHNEDL